MQLSSCFLLTMKEDSIDGIYDTLKQCAVISKYALSPRPRQRTHPAPSPTPLPHPHLSLLHVIGRYAGGIGLSIHHIRASNSYIRGTNGSSNGIVPMLRVFNNTARYADLSDPPTHGSHLSLSPLPLTSPSQLSLWPLSLS